MHCKIVHGEGHKIWKGDFFSGWSYWYALALYTKKNV